MKPTPNYPIIDLHCDLLHYLATTPNATVNDTDVIGVALPHLKSGNVKLQVLAVFTFTEKGSVAVAQKEFECYHKMLEMSDFEAVTNKSALQNILTSDKTGIIPAIESASGICEEDEPLDNAFKRFDEIIEQCGHIIYIGFTHHTENRFGGGNYSDNIGLKDDGKVLLDYLDGKKIAVDLAHTSDNLAMGIMDYIDAKSLDIPIIASHSNFRILCDHVRNLPDEYVMRLVRENGLIGMNFLRAYIHDTDPSHFIEHFLHGLDETIAPNQMAFGADFFYRSGLEALHPERIPLFFDEHLDASKYPSVLNDLRAKGVGEEALQKLCYQNALDFLERVW